MSKAKQSKADSMRVKIYAPFKVYYDAQANSLSAANRIGPFDVLPQHHNFISLLESGNIVVRASGKEDFSMPIKRGIMHIKADFVRVFLDI